MCARYGLTLTAGRLFGLRLVSPTPLSLDDIAATLGVSKSGASAAARDLERLGIIGRQGTSGSRRIVYEANDDMDALFDATVTRIREGLQMVRRGAPRGPRRAPGPGAAPRPAYS